MEDKLVKKEYNLCKAREREKEKYYARKQGGMCVQCGKTKAVSGKTKCESCTKKVNELNKEAYYFFKSISICPRCKKNKISNNGTLCEECKEKSRKYNMNRQEYFQSRYNKFKENNLCPMCSNKAELGHVYCSNCLKIKRMSRKREE